MYLFLLFFTARPSNNVLCTINFQYVSVQSPIWFSDAGSRATTPLLSGIHIPIIGNQKIFCTRMPPIQSIWFLLRVCRPIKADHGADPFFNLRKMKRRRFPISPDDSHRPRTGFRRSFFFIQTLISYQNLSRSLHAIQTWPVYKPMPFLLPMYFCAVSCVHTMNLSQDNFSPPPLPLR